MPTTNSRPTSRLASAIEATQTGQRAVLPSPYALVFQATDRLEPTEKHIGIEYRIEAIFGARVIIAESEMVGPRALREAKRRVRRLVVEAVFGEFRDDLQALHHALLQRDVHKAESLLDELSQRMFDV